MTSSSEKVSLSSELFKSALDRYIDEYKPDPLARQQLQSWSLRWKDDDDDNNNNHKDGWKAITENADFLPQPSHFLHGSLEIGGEYMVITIYVCCRWKNHLNNDGKATHQYGQLFFSSSVSARFLTKTEWKEVDPKGSDEDARDKKTKDKIRAKMVKRLKEDAYVSKLLEVSIDSQKKPDEANNPRLLAEAKIQFTSSDLEERVTVLEDICEGIRRSVWSSAESPLDVIEVLLNLPLLPTSEHKPVDNEESSSFTTSTLANRAKLRLLEDAMCDACEKEGEDELLDDLRISEKRQKR